LLELLAVSYNSKVRVFDVACHRGMEEILNFNNPLPAELIGAFDFVFDSSCLEHCFNVAQAFQNMCEAVRVGGTVITIAPIYLFNHGYYNINPIMHQDGFTHNGFTLLHQNIINGSGEVVGLHPKKDNPRNTYILSVACKEVEQPFTWPMQTHKGLGINYTNI
jgi:SAM-dependent methyltransferase